MGERNGDLDKRTLYAELNTPYSTPYSIITTGGQPPTVVLGAIESAIERARHFGFVFDAKAVRGSLESQFESNGSARSNLGAHGTEVLVSLSRFSPTSYRVDIAYRSESKESNRAANIIFRLLSRGII